MPKIDYINILKNSWHLTWHNRFLWWFGLILVIGGGGFNLNFPLSTNNEKIDNEKFIQAASAFLDRYWQWIAAGAILLFILIIIIAVLKIISRAGLIKSISEIILGKTATFKKGFNEGKKYFWKLFFLGLMIFLFIMGIILALLTPVIFLVYLKSYIWAAILGVFAVLLIIVLGIIISFIKEYSRLYLVLSNLNVKNSLENGYLVFRKNILPSVIFSLLLVAIGMIVGLAILFSVIIIAAVFFIFGLAAYLLLKWVGVVMVAIPGILAIIAVGLAVQSIFAVFRQTAWILFFQEIAAIKSEETVKEKETIKVSEKVLDAGEA
ncbi:MAG: hypothetical protein V1804_02670 [Patescibacteria group bacterium]